ncbi:MAG TPA: GTP cyclohydrolase IIa [Nitrososphaeraceae archaeon]|nr:GTP cyclohydrolase IIa [Nitrososphaeraceae archaeon]
MTIQITIIRIEGYGPWTLTLGTDREAQIQMLQARIYYDVQRLFSQKECLVYLNRFDEYFAITNGLSLKDHKDLQKEIATLYKNLKISMTIGKGNTPFEANINAYEARKTGNLIDRETRIFGQTMSSSPSSKASSSTTNSNYSESAHIMHIDINGSEKISSKMSPYEITALVMKLYAKLSEAFLKKGAMTFFLGGDNFMVISNNIKKEEAEIIIKSVANGIGITLNCGIGIGRNGRRAAEAATRALDTIRDLRNEGKIQPIYEIQCL